jgi:hypothetical protein
VILGLAGPHAESDRGSDDDQRIRSDEARGLEGGPGLAGSHAAKAPGEGSGGEERGVLDLVADLRKDVAAPLVLFSYANPVVRYGVEAMCVGMGMGAVFRWSAGEAAYPVFRSV